MYELKKLKTELARWAGTASTATKKPSSHAEDPATKLETGRMLLTVINAIGHLEERIAELESSSHKH